MNDLTFGVPVKGLSYFGSAPKQKLNLAGANSNYSDFIPEGVDPTMAWLYTQAQEEARKRNDPQRIKEQLEILEPMFQRRAEQQMKYGMMSNAFASFLTGVPAAIKDYAYAGRQYDPTRINIAAQQILPASSIPNMTVNIPARNYFG
jgi:hypothetical protein